MADNGGEPRGRLAIGRQYTYVRAQESIGETRTKGYVMDNQTTAGESGPQGQIQPGMAIIDVYGHRVGHVSDEGVQGQYVVMHKGLIWSRDVFIPLGTVRAVDEEGIHLALTRKEVEDLASANPPGAEEATYVEHETGGWSGLGEVDLDTGVRAGDKNSAHPDAVANFPDGNDAVGALTDTGVPTGLPFRSRLKRAEEDVSGAEGATESPAQDTQDTQDTMNR